jgi:tRNA(Arg) A34 adenosine deaminase TadA
MLAQQRLATFDLGAAHLPAMELFASSQPCIQCFGNTWWSGVQALTIGARAEDVESNHRFQRRPAAAGLGGAAGAAASSPAADSS